jgi:hypothetical protein
LLRLGVGTTAYRRYILGFFKEACKKKPKQAVYFVLQAEEEKVRRM